MIEKVEAEVKDDIQKAVDRAEKLMKEYTDPLVMFDHVYAEMPPTLRAQREEFLKEAGEAKEEVDNE